MYLLLKHGDFPARHFSFRFFLGGSIYITIRLVKTTPTFFSARFQVIQPATRRVGKKPKSSPGGRLCHRVDQLPLFPYNPSVPNTL